MKNYCLAFIIFFTFFTCLNAQTQLGADIYGDASGDSFGKYVSISNSGDVIAISGMYNDNNGNNSGHVKIYKNISGTWTQIGDDIEGVNTSDQSGASISLSNDGNIVAISAPWYNGIRTDTGHVRIFENISGTWTQIGSDIEGSQLYEKIGTCVRLSGDGSIIAIGVTGNSQNNSGHVSIYKNISGTWTQIGNDIEGENIGDYFGASVSLSDAGNIVAIGSTYNSDNGTRFGHVRIYENISNVWTQVGNDINGISNISFSKSISLSIDGNIVAIGATGYDNRKGLVQIYQNVAGNWTQVGGNIIGKSTYSSSGDSVSLSDDGTVVAIGAPESSSDRGYARLYKNMSGSWVQFGNDITGLISYDRLGTSVGLSGAGNIVAIGADQIFSGDSKGFCSVYDFSSELALLEVKDDIQGNVNGVNVTAAQLNSIIGVSGAIEDVNYSLALADATFANPNNPTAIEVQAVVDSVNSTLSIEENKGNYFKVYPNPVKDILNIELNNGLVLKEVNIYNSLGQFMTVSSKLKIITSKFSKGIYFLEVETNEGSSTKTIVVE